MPAPRPTAPSRTPSWPARCTSPSSLDRPLPATATPPATPRLATPRPADPVACPRRQGGIFPPPSLPLTMADSPRPRRRPLAAPRRHGRHDADDPAPARPPPPLPRHAPVSKTALHRLGHGCARLGLPTTGECGTSGPHLVRIWFPGLPISLDLLSHLPLDLSIIVSPT